MELWIRSQDKEILMNCKSFKVRDYEDRYRIYGSCDGIEIQPLGDYVKGERALEILDEIQNILIINKQINGSYEECDLATKKMLVESQYKIYEMPKE